MAFDYREFIEFSEQLHQAQKKHERFIRDFLTEMGMRAMGKTIKRTPVGLGDDDGHLRDRWELSEVIRKGDELVIVLFNPKLYASFVEDGHMQYARWVPGRWQGDNFVYDENERNDGMMLTTRWVPGVHMARRSLTEIEIELPQRYKKAFNQFLIDMGLI